MLHIGCKCTLMLSIGCKCTSMLPIGCKGTSVLPIGCNTVLWIRINIMRIQIRRLASGITDPDPALGERFLRVLFLCKVFHSLHFRFF